MEEPEGVLRAKDLRKLFQRKDVAEIRIVLQQHNVDVHSCVWLEWPGSGFLSSPMDYAIKSFDRDVMHMLLNEFGANFNAHCYRSICNLPNPPVGYPLYQLEEFDEVEFMLDHGAVPFIFDDMNDIFADNGDKGRLILAARDRLRTAWAAAWALSQRPQCSGAWALRDMAQPVAQRIMGTPVREFLEGEQKKKRKTGE